MTSPVLTHLSVQLQLQCSPSEGNKYSLSLGRCPWLPTTTKTACSIHWHNNVSSVRRIRLEYRNLSYSWVHLAQCFLLCWLAISLQVLGTSPIWRYQGLNLGVGPSTAGYNPSSFIKSSCTLYTAQNFPLQISSPSTWPGLTFFSEWEEDEIIALGDGVKQMKMR